MARRHDLNHPAGVRAAIDEAVQTIAGAEDEIVPSLAIDLAGQVVADTMAGTQFSGIGGHEDFIAGAGLELSDRSLVCLPSTATADGRLVSRITPSLAPGSIVTTPRHQLDVVITEYGVAEVLGMTVRERAEALAAIAHPDFREELIEAAAATS